MAGKLSTHVLDTAHGKPAVNVRIRLYRGDKFVLESFTNNDGRPEAALLAGPELVAGEYRLEFSVGEYFRQLRHPDAGKFLETVSVDFVVADAGQGYHVPLLVSPWSFSTYRGS